MAVNHQPEERAPATERSRTATRSGKGVFELDRKRGAASVGMEVVFDETYNRPAVLAALSTSISLSSGAR